MFFGDLASAFFVDVSLPGIDAGGPGPGGGGRNGDGIIGARSGGGDRNDGFIFGAQSEGQRPAIRCGIIRNGLAPGDGVAGSQGGGDVQFTGSSKRV